jgi:hypothetical protein
MNGDPRRRLSHTLLGLIVTSLLVSIASCLPSSEPARRSASDLRFDIVSTEDYGAYVYVKVEITNVSQKRVDKANVTCVLYDKTGKEIGFQTHYVVKSREGGLAPGATTYFTYIVNGDYSRTARVGFNVKSIK